MTVQHTIILRIDGRQTTVNCPPFVSPAVLEQWLTEYKAAYPTTIVISKSWSANDIQPKRA